MDLRSPHQPRIRALRFARAASCAASIALCVMALHGGSARGDVATRGFIVIVNPANPARSVSKDLLARAYLKRVTRWPSGDAIAPVDLPESTLARRVFSSDVLKRPPAAIRSYWLQRIFTGRELPPLQLDTESEVIRYVRSTRGALAYVAATTNPEHVRVLAIHE